MSKQLPKRPELRILISNDDGIHAPGIAVLEKIARSITDDVWVVAPDKERSGAGHSVSLTEPLRMRRIDERHYEVDGTPTDCVLMAVCEILEDRPPDYVFSGINSGANLAEDVSKSGTIAAAMEGTLMGIRSVAISTLRGPERNVDFAAAEHFVPEILHKLLDLPQWPAQSLININVPYATVGEICDVRITRQGQRPPGSFSIISREDTRGQPYHWVKVSYLEGEKIADTDLHAIAENAIAVTPIKMDFTDVEWRKTLREVISV